MIQNFLDAVVKRTNCAFASDDQAGHWYRDSANYRKYYRERELTKLLEQM